LDKSFRLFFNAAMERRVPVVYAVIPGMMDQGLIRFLRKAKEKTPHLLDIVQHGWVHANHSKIQGKKYEFGSSRSLKLQREDIQRGFKKMQQAFGDLFTPAFVPPYHGYDLRTLRILKEEIFWAFSIGKVEGKCQLVQLPAEVSFTRYNKDGSRSINTANDMVEMLGRKFYRQLIPGVITHHEDFKSKEAWKELNRFFNFIETLCNKGKWRAISFAELRREMSEN
jgi:peptidoglycan/xylan/chitin deacetylase (PgdA/CDA1 family)